MSAIECPLPRTDPLFIKYIQERKEEGDKDPKFFSKNEIEVPLMDSNWGIARFSFMHIRPKEAIPVWEGNEPHIDTNAATRGGWTLCLLRFINGPFPEEYNNFMGIARCSDEDTFCYREGRKRALRMAMRESGPRRLSKANRARIWSHIKKFKKDKVHGEENIPGHSNRGAQCDQGIST